MKNIQFWPIDKIVKWSVKGRLQQLYVIYLYIVRYKVISACEIDFSDASLRLIVGPIIVIIVK